MVGSKNRNHHHDYGCSLVEIAFTAPTYSLFGPFVPYQVDADPDWTFLGGGTRGTAESSSDSSGDLSRRDEMAVPKGLMIPMAVSPNKISNDASRDFSSNQHLPITGSSGID
jgi:hypothetical protein